MNDKALVRIGLLNREVRLTAAQALTETMKAGMARKKAEQTLRRVVADPAPYSTDPIWGPLARVLERPGGSDRKGAEAPFFVWGQDLDREAMAQMEEACRLPVAVRGALLPDVHVGYGLPIGGVLATRGAVIPYAVGMDIACRMRLSVLDGNPKRLDSDREILIQALESGTRFGVGGTFSPPHDHPVMDRDWDLSPVLKKNKDRAWQQLGTSGAGNHFAEFGFLEAPEGLGTVEPGLYLALLTHSGSRGTGGEVATHYSRLAARLRPGSGRLAWLHMDRAEGREYWAAMALMGHYAAANHELIHRHVTELAGCRIRATVENHHNFAWRERVEGEGELIVHRKGATPAHAGELGIMPGTMVSPAHVVEGLGNPASLWSAAHGAGRRMSRKEAARKFSMHRISELLDKHGVTVLSAGPDEGPDAYKDIDEVVSAQANLVRSVARFYPRIVKMAGERRAWSFRSGS
ncbi:MAG: RtcB family protein [Deltaproteobacteria bacterium]|nr:RtcB family protein [Deltaproteobacteria bacterium]